MFLALALLSALALGSADFVGGLAVRRAAAVAVVVWVHATGLALTVLLVLTVLPARPVPADLCWGALAGLAGSVGGVLLYRALAVATMSVVAPTSAAVAAAVPVSAGLLLGERLTSLTALGVLGSLAAIVLISRTPSGGAVRRARRSAGLLGAVVAGVSFGLFLVLLGQTTPGSGLWPLVAARCISLPVLVLMGAAGGTSLRLPRSTVMAAGAAGALDIAAAVLYLAALRGGQLGVTGVLASLAPLGTVALARVLLRERLHTTQTLGAALAMASVLLLAASPSP